MPLLYALERSTKEALVIALAEYGVRKKRCLTYHAG
jgi:hypothetical protein